MRFVLLLFAALVCRAAAWDDDDMEVFDVVEEVNQNFYELMGVAQVRTSLISLFKYGKKIHRITLRPGFPGLKL